MNIKDSVVLVTGANRGLGLAFAQGLLAAGARKVYAAARDPSSVKLEGVVPVALDVTNPAQIAALAHDLKDVTLVINNAGIAKGVALLSPDAVATARAELETNLFGPLYIAQAFAPVLKANGGGAILNVLSALSWVNFPSVATYSVSKSAAWSLTNGLRGELERQGTQVVGLHVGYMDTDMAAHITTPKTSPKEVVRKAIEVIEAGGSEVLADEVSVKLKGALSQGAYLLPAGQR